MSFSVAMLEAMKAEGLDLDACIRIFKAAGPETTLEKRRAYDRQRKAEKREAERLSTGLSTGNPPDGFPNEREYLTPSSPPVISNEITPPSENDDLKPEDVIEAWNVMAGDCGVPKARMTPERRRKIKTLIGRHSVDDITEAIWVVPQTPFLRGENDRGWKANIDFMLNPTKFTKMIEKTYGEQAH